MKQYVYKDDGVIVSSENGKYHIQYDAGSHQIAMRKDEISKDDAENLAADPATIEDILFSLQKRLIAQGIDPYKSNI
jgi:hypothetical protein